MSLWAVKDNDASRRVGHIARRRIDGHAARSFDRVSDDLFEIHLPESKGNFRRVREGNDERNGAVEAQAGPGSSWRIGANSRLQKRQPISIADGTDAHARATPPSRSRPGVWVPLRKFSFGRAKGRPFFPHLVVREAARVLSLPAALLCYADVCDVSGRPQGFSPSTFALRHFLFPPDQIFELNQISENLCGY